ncbi:MAG: HdeD family acid-resistance protein [Bacteroidota bacterium]
MKKMYGNWWIEGLKGLLALIFGIAALLYPDVTLVTLVTYFGIFAIIAGIIVSLMALIYRRRNRFSDFWIFEGILDIIIGVLLVAYPRGFVNVFLIIIAIWAILTGILQLASSRGLKGLVKNIWLYRISAFMLIIFGIVVLFNPFEGGMALTAILGILAIIYGITAVISSAKLARAND